MNKSVVDSLILNDENDSRLNLNQNKFPTVGLKSLLQNSDLLELLLKPLSSKSSDESSDSLPSPSSSMSNTKETSDDLLIIPPTLPDTMPDLNLLDDPKSKSLFDWENSDEYFEMKVNKIANSDGDNTSKIYGNAFLGPNLWDKNDLFQGEKFGVKFEYLEIDEFLNENGLNETDVEFLDQIQKIDNINSIQSSLSTSAQTVSNVNGASPNVSQTSAQNLSPPLSSSKASISPSLSSVSVSSPSSSSSSSSSVASSPLSSSIQQQSSTSRAGMSHGQSDIKAQTARTSSAIIAEQHNYSSNMSKLPQSLNNMKESLSNDNAMSRGSSSNMRSSLNDTSYDWNSNSNDVSIDSMDELDDYDAKFRKLSEEDLRPQPVLRKSKKQFVPSEMKDDKYWARRKKNNVAAKRSRDARRMKENQIAIRASYLERENDSLRKQLDDFKRETKLLKIKLARYESTSMQSNLDLSTIEESSK